MPEKKSFGEKMIAAGDAMQEAGNATSQAGCSVTVFVVALAFLVLIGCFISALL